MDISRLYQLKGGSGIIYQIEGVSTKNYMTMNYNYYGEGQLQKYNGYLSKSIVRKYPSGKNSSISSCRGLLTKGIWVVNTSKLK